MNKPVFKEQVVNYSDSTPEKYRIFPKKFSVKSGFNNDLLCYENRVFKKFFWFGKRIEKSKFLRYQMDNANDPIEWHKTFLNLFYYEEKKYRNSTSVQLWYHQRMDIAEEIIDELEPIGKIDKAKSDFSFGLSDNQIRILKNIFEVLITRIDLIDETRCSRQDLIDIFIASDFRDLNNRIYLLCDTKEFAFCLKEIKSNFKKITYSKIGRTELFYSQSGNLITENNISSSLHLNAKNIDVIREIVKSFS